MADPIHVFVGGMIQHGSPAGPKMQPALDQPAALHEAVNLDVSEPDRAQGRPNARQVDETDTGNLWPRGRAS